METIEQLQIEVQRKEENPTGAFNERLGYHFKELHSFRLFSSLGILQKKILIISYQMLVLSMMYTLVQT